MAKRAVVLEPGDRQHRAALQMLSTIHKDKTTKRHSANVQRLKEKKKEQERKQNVFADDTKERKRKQFQEHGLKVAKRSKLAE